MTERHDQDDYEDMTETVEVRRFAESLDTLQAGDRLDIDPSEDPELSQLVATSVALADTITAATETPRFESYRLRSRTAILGRLQPAPAETTPEPISFWHRRWMNFAAPVVSAAAAAALTLAFVIATDDPSPVGDTGTQVQTVPAESAAPADDVETILPLPEEQLAAAASLVERLEAIQADLNELELRNNNGELVTADFLRALTERQATVAADIANAEPGSLEDGLVTTAFSTTIITFALLEGAETEASATGALEAARQQSLHARQIAADYLVATQFTITAETPLEEPAEAPDQADMPIEFEGSESF